MIFFVIQRLAHTEDAGVVALRYSLRPQTELPTSLRCFLRKKIIELDKREICRCIESYLYDAGELDFGIATGIGIGNEDLVKDLSVDGNCLVDADSVRVCGKLRSVVVPVVDSNFPADADDVGFRVRTFLVCYKLDR